LIQQERQLLHDLVQLAGERARAEKEVQEGFESRNKAAEAEFQEVRRRIDQDYQSAKRQNEQDYQQSRQRLTAQFEAERNANDKDHARTRQRILQQFHTDKEKNEKEWQDARWTTHALLEGNKTRAEGQWKDVQRKMAAHLERIDTIRREAAEFLKDWLKPRTPDESDEGPADELQEEDSLRQLRDRMSSADAYLEQAKNLVLLKVIRSEWLIGLGVFLVLFVLSYAAWATGWYYQLGGITLGIVIAGIGIRVWAHAVAQRQVNQIYHPLCRVLGQSESCCHRYRDEMGSAYNRQIARDQEQHDTTLREAEEKHDQRVKEINERRDTGLRQAESKYQKQAAEMAERRDTEARDVEEKHKRLQAEIQERYDSDTAQINEHYERLLADSKATHEDEWQRMAEAWRQGLARAQARTAAITQETARFFPAWSEAIWHHWQPPSEPAPVIRFGDFHISLDQIADGIPGEPALKTLGPSDFTLPALVAFPEPSEGRADAGPDRGSLSMLVKASDSGRQPAEQALQLIMFRLLTALPPGKVRFTIIDPIGLGQNFAAFMHLTDHMEALVSSRIWTEHQHIEQRLADLTAHMENVIQKYLRNQYQTIEEFNVHAGEVAEPFRFVVVANFPANFSPEAARRLASIAASGARCGVHTLVSVGAKQMMPQGFDLKDLEQHSIILSWKGDRFVWQDRDFGRFPLRLDPAPEADFTTRLLQVVGQKAKEASRVEVPFEFITSPREQWWTRESRSGIDVALGRSGATKRQHLTLGQGTAQHVLIAGKTGSGKSTLLHALITNLALQYSPEEVELYLVDFKEGVEFKAYATYELPHARLVAIESEREFGLSVLQRLEGELKSRGDKFRAAGVQDLSNYRQLNGSATMPRILLIVDEFQLFFIDDDKIAQEAALLLDRLVRQGRAFGIHCLLGSQTLGGAYTLARSTIGQMAVRIALQCSEADAHMILSDDNPAARLLSRPGEAIYNDANGLVEGNDFFQVVWLGEEQRESYLRCIRELAEQHGHVPPEPQIVFEGKAPADAAKNHLLTELLHQPTWPTGPRVASAWVGEAMAIKDATAAGFRRQSGSNLIMIGQVDETALGIMTTALISLAAQQLPAALPDLAQFYVLDASPIDAVHVGYLGRLAEIVPHPLKSGGWRELPALLGELAAEVERRQQVREGEAPPIYVFVYSLQRFRDLRRQEDDFSFSRRGEDKPPNPAKLFGTILREGPALGVHTIVWCDTLNNLNRTLDRQGLREFEMRVLFQMSAADSSNLIDTPLASKLGLHRALFYTEDRGQPEKFRPYGVPSRAWLEDVKTAFSLKQTDAAK
jgi:DNA segregation ATPase FtsK/SpoIIIE-like protein